VKQVKGFWLPDYEQHLVPFLEKGPSVHGGPTYQYHKLSPALALVPANRRQHAVDVGAHCGLWSRILRHEFEHLTAFEPVAIHRQCFIKNVAEPYDLIPYALGAEPGTICLHTGESSSGDTYVQADGEHAAEIKTLDSFDFAALDFLKIDCEGYEYFILQGGEETIRRTKPVIIVEQKPKKGSKYGLTDTAAVDLLRGWGMRLEFVMSGDYCFTY
jgi:FkbM family methyltransferase